MDSALHRSTPTHTRAPRRAVPPQGPAAEMQLRTLTLIALAALAAGAQGECHAARGVARLRA